MVIYGGETPGFNSSLSDVIKAPQHGGGEEVVVKVHQSSSPESKELQVDVAKLNNKRESLEERAGSDNFQIMGNNLPLGVASSTTLGFSLLGGKRATIKRVKRKKRKRCKTVKKRGRKRVTRRGKGGCVKRGGKKGKRVRRVKTRKRKHV
jgi:hypothetical protein